MTSEHFLDCYTQARASQPAPSPLRLCSYWQLVLRQEACSLILGRHTTRCMLCAKSRPPAASPLAPLVVIATRQASVQASVLYFVPGPPPTCCKTGSTYKSSAHPAYTRSWKLDITQQQNNKHQHNISSWSLWNSSTMSQWLAPFSATGSLATRYAATSLANMILAEESATTNMSLSFLSL